MVEREENWYRRRIKEALKIQQCQVRMNLDQGIVLRSGWKPFYFFHNTIYVWLHVTDIYIYKYIYNTGSYATIITHFIRVDICIIRVHTQLL